MTRTRTALLLAALCLLGACASVPREPAGSASAIISVAPSSVARSSAAPNAAANRTAADREALRLLDLARVPPGAKPLAKPPAAVADGPVGGAPMTSSMIDHPRYWRVAMRYDDAVAWITAHPPQGLRADGNSRGSGPAAERSEGLDYADAETSAWTQAELQVGVATDGDASDIRADGMALWLDPAPIRDDAPGLRLRVTVAAGCPKSDANVGGVSNQGADLDTRLVPDAQPTAGLVCSYDGMNGASFGLVQFKPLSAEAARKLANVLRHESLAHLDDVMRSCPMADGAAAVIALAYANRPDVDVWWATNGCEALANGHIQASPDDALITGAQPLTGVGSPPPHS